MELIEGLENLSAPQPRAVVTIGKFFAVHVGHQALIRATCESALRRGARSVALTFDRHPQEILMPGTRFPILLPLAERLERIAALGVDCTVLVRLDRKFLSQTPEEFARAVLAERLHGVELVASDNFRFGRGAVGTVDTLRGLGRQLGFEVTVVDPVLVEGERVSTSRVVACLVEGRVELAAELLGQPYSLTGEVATGDRRGQELGFPTANLALPVDRLLPADGVYAGHATSALGIWPAVTNVGVRPTVDGTRRLVEAHLLEFHGDLYRRELTVSFQERLRGEEKFASLEALREQIARDVAEAALRLKSGSRRAGG